MYISQLCVPPTTKKQRTLLEKLVNQILAAKKSNPQADTTTLEAEIDQLVYQLYQLTETEIKIIESNTQ